MYMYTSRSFCQFVVRSRISLIIMLEIDQPKRLFSNVNSNSKQFPQIILKLNCQHLSKAIQKSVVLDWKKIFIQKQNPLQKYTDYD